MLNLISFDKFIGLLKDFKSLQNLCQEKTVALTKIFNLDVSKDLSHSLSILKSNFIPEENSSSPRRKTIEIVKIRRKAERGKTKLRDICQTLFNLCRFLMPLNMLQNKKKKLVSIKSNIKRMEKCMSKVDNSAFFEEVQQKEIKTHLLIESENFSFCEYYYQSYDLFKKKLSSVNASHNNFLNILLEKTTEAKEICESLCYFYMMQLRVENWTPKNQKSIFKLVKCFINTFFFVTGPMQENIYKIVQNNEIKKILNNLWEKLRFFMNYVKSKTTLNKIFKESYEHVIVLLKVHQFLCEDNNRKFKDFFRNEEISHLKHNRLIGLVEMFSKICDSNSWHENYDIGRLDYFPGPNKPYLFPLGIANLECLSELLTGPCLENQKQVFKFNYDKINGILNRYCKDIDSLFYRMKEALVEMILTTAEGVDDEIIMFQSTNIEVCTINTVIINSLKQLFCEKKANKDKQNYEFIGDYTIKMENFQEMLDMFENNSEFSEHPLMNLSIKLYFYIRLLSEKITKYDLFCKDRQKAMKDYAIEKKIEIKALGEDDLLCFQFLMQITSKVEIIAGKTLFLFYFKKSANSSYLTDETKIKFEEEEADRETSESKLVSLISQVKFFEEEIEMNSNKFRNKKTIYKYFDNTIFKYLEWITLAIAFLINFIILQDYKQKGPPFIYEGDYLTFITFLSIIECSISFCSVLIWTYLKYSVSYQINYLKFVDAKYSGQEENLTFFEKLDLRLFTGFFKQDRVGSFLIHMMFSILGLKVSNGFFGLELLTIINLSRTLQYVIKSVTAHSSQLLWTLFFGFITMYAYSIFAFVYFFEDFGEDGGFCNSLSQCFISVLSMAFTNGTGIGGLMNQEEYVSENRAKFYGQMLLSMSFFIIVNIIMMNIIFGVIVDTFGELRDKLEASSIYFFH